MCVCIFKMNFKFQMFKSLHGSPNLHNDKCLHGTHRAEIKMFQIGNTVVVRVMGQNVLIGCITYSHIQCVVYGITQYCNVFGVVETPFGLLIRFIPSRHYSYLLHCYTATRQSLHSIHSRFRLFSLTVT
jgi:hypothetical protein